MKKTIKRILLGLGIAVLLIVLFAVAYTIKAKSEINKMASTETKEIIDNIYAIQDSFTNLFLIKDGDTYIAIDGGNNLDVVSEGLNKLGIKPDQINTILLTHTDGDHIAAISLFKKAQVYLSKQEEQLLNGEKARFLFFGNNIQTKEYSLINDQEVLQFGNIKVKGILTPGHTIGSMCYLINDKYLFTGDAIGLKDGKIHAFNDFFNMDTKMSIQSIEKITSLSGLEYIFTAHYGYTNDFTDAISGWKK